MTWISSDLSKKFRGHRTDAKNNDTIQQASSSIQISYNGEGMSSADFYMLEAQEKKGYLYGCIKDLHSMGILTSAIRRNASKGAKDFLLDMCQKDLNNLPHTPQTEGLVRVALIGYASQINVAGIFSNPPTIFNRDQLVSACTHAGKAYVDLLALAQKWYPGMMLLSSLEGITPSLTQEDKACALREAYATYKDDPSTNNAEKVVMYLLPVSVARVCTLTERRPTIEEAVLALHRAMHNGRGYRRAVKNYIASLSDL